MRIAYIINSLEGGGAATMVPSITGFLRDRGHEVRIFALTPRDRLAEPHLRDAGMKITLRDGGDRDHFRAFMWLYRSLAEWRPTHIWTSLTRATLLGQPVGRLLRVPVISWQHNAFLKPANLRLLKATRRMSALWLGDSRSVTDITRARLKFGQHRLMCWPVFRALPQERSGRPWHPGDVIRIGSLGRLHPSKGYDVLCAALKQIEGCGELPPFRISIAGEGRERATLEALVARDRLSCIDFAGFSPSSSAFLADKHLYLQPSMREGFCIAAHEAMQAGLAVIGSAVGEMKYSIEDGVTGWQVRPGDPADLARALHTALSRPEELALKGQAARNNVLDRFGVPRFEAAGSAVLEAIERF